MNYHYPDLDHFQNRTAITQVLAVLVKFPT